LEKLGVEKIFWQVAQKPGKPLYFGKKRKTLIFGLPGNPVSVWVCFYEYVRPSLKAMQGWKKTPTRRSKAALGVAIKSTGPSTVFLRGLLQRNNGDATVKPFTHQGSHMLKALAEADCLIPLPPQGKAFEAGEEVEIHPFNGLEGDFL
jgi:molybdopterin molybdotransferase